MSTVFLMCGLAFSGKTTLARHIVKEFGCAYLNLDDINDERGLWGGDGLPVDEWETTHRIAVARMNARLDDGECVVVDDTSNLRWLRDRFRKAAEEASHDLVLVYVTAPLSEIRRRMTEAGETGERRGVAQVVFEEHVDSFEEPTDDEGAVVHRSGENIEALLRELKVRRAR